MATWIPLQSSFPNHPKTKKLRRAMGDVAVLKVIELWLWMSEYHGSGVLPDDPDEIAAGIDLPDDIDAEQFTAKLEELGFLDRTDDGLAVHNWHERFGRWEERRLAQRARDRERKRKQRGEAPQENQAPEAMSHPIPPGLPTDKSGVPSNSAQRPLRKRRGDNKESGTSRGTWMGQAVRDTWGDLVPPELIADPEELDPGSRRWPREWFEKFPAVDEQGVARPQQLTPASEPFLLTSREPASPDQVSSRYRPLVARTKDGRTIPVPYGESVRILASDPIVGPDLAHYLPTAEIDHKPTKKPRKPASRESSDVGA